MVATLLAASCSVDARSPVAATQRGPGLRELGAIALPGVEGCIDHLALDRKRLRLYVAALENDTLEVVDLMRGARERQLQGLAEPQGVLYLDELDRVVVSNGKSGRLDVFDGETLERRASVDVGEDADNLRWDPRTKEVIVGQGDGALVAVDARTWSVAKRFELAAHPESFQLAGADERIFANTPAAKQIAVLDRAGKSEPRLWPVSTASANYPLALLEIDQRVLVGCREPARLLAFDTKTGEQRASLELSGDCDDIFYDAERGRVFVSCGAGFIDVFARREPGAFSRTQQVATAAGARTCLLVPELHRLYLAVPHRGSHRAEVRMFELVP
jgi:hypothetical protein